MNKNILLFALCSILTVAIYAQTYKVNPGYLNEQKASDQSDGVVLGYCSEKLVMQVGKGENTEVAAAIYLPALMLKPYVGNKIKTIRYGLMSATTETSVFIKKDLNGDNVVAKSVGDATRGWNEVELEYTIGEEGLYIGYEAKGTDPLALSDNYSENGLFLRESDGSWGNYAQMNAWNALNVEIIVNGDNMPVNVMSIFNLDDIYAQQNKSFIISGIVENLSVTTVNNYEITYKIDDGETKSQTFNGKMLASNYRDTFRIELSSLNEVKDYKIEVNLSKVNGVANTNTYNNTWESLIYCKEYLFPRKVVIEEGSGTWCKYCVRGIVGMQEMKKRYPENFIGIVSHKGDVMAASSYAQLHSKFFSAGLPNSVVNRKSNLVVDPALENLEKAFKKECIPSDIGIEVTASFTSNNKDAIDIRTTTTFGFSEENVAYRIALVLVEDNVTGTGQQYEQLNAYTKESGGQFDGMEMGGFENLPYVVPADQMVYENVARGIYKSFVGNLNSVPYIVEKGVGYKFSYTIDKTSFKSAKVNNKENLLIVALLLDTNTGEIINADRVKVGEYNPLDMTNSEISELKVYAIDGRICVEGTYDNLHVFTSNGIEVGSDNLQYGIYFVQIIRGSDIIVRKVYVSQ